MLMYLLLLLLMLLHLVVVALVVGRGEVHLVVGIGLFRVCDGILAILVGVINELYLFVDV